MSDREWVRNGMGRRAFVALVGAAGVSALAGCGSDDAGEGSTPTPDGATTPSATATSTGTEPDTPETGGDPTGGSGGAPESGEDPVGSLPVPDTGEVPRPSGDPGNLRVLDWAGFEGAVSYTFDDGQPSQVEHYGALQSTGVDMTFYVSENVHFEGADAAWRRAAADGHEIGNHTVSHPQADLTESSFGESLESPAAEIEGCSAYITETTGQRDVWTMAAPFGDAGWSDPAREADLFLNRGVGGGAVAPGDDTDPYDLPCYMAREGDTAERFDGLVDAARSDGTWQLLLFHSVAPTDQEWYAPVDVEEITTSVDHATSLGDVWVDTVASIGAYWRGQRLLESAERTESDGETAWTWSVPEAFPDGQRVRVTVDGGTLRQGGEELSWDPRGYYEVVLDAESLTLVP